MTDRADRHLSDRGKIKNKPKSVQRDRRAWDQGVLPELGKVEPRTLPAEVSPG